jgi:hypothetical protein
MFIVACTADFYKLLGVTKESSEREIKKAYHKLALKHHPVSWSLAQARNFPQSHDISPEHVLVTSGIFAKLRSQLSFPCKKCVFNGVDTKHQPHATRLGASQDKSAACKKDPESEGCKKSHRNFMKISKAYETLTDPAKKRFYDQTGFESPEAQQEVSACTFASLCYIFVHGIASCKFAYLFLSCLDSCFTHTAKKWCVSEI